MVLVEQRIQRRIKSENLLSMVKLVRVIVKGLIVILGVTSHLEGSEGGGVTSVEKNVLVNSSPISNNDNEKVNNFSISLYY